jgi:uncharacterized Zn finger protein (UPF0148 family)
MLQPLSERCVECEGPLLRDDENGESVCSNCGLVNYTETKVPQ